MPQPCQPTRCRVCAGVWGLLNDYAFTGNVSIVILLLLQASIWSAQAQTPFNDSFARNYPLNPVNTAAWSGNWNGSNLGATRETNEPPANTGGHSIWFRWSAPLSGVVAFDTVGSTFDTLLAGYEAGRLRFPGLPQLVLLAASDNIDTTNSASRVTFPVNAGWTYYLAVDGANGSEGQVALHWSLTPDAARRPDLVMRRDTIAPQIEMITFGTNSCTLSANCAQAGTRKLLRFGTAARNVGNADLVLAGLSNLVYEFHPCHQHYHLLGFADYRLKTNGGTTVVTGFKASFCIEDYQRWDTNAYPEAIYSCSGQGLQAGWDDYYWAALDCQWVDITGVPPGLYRLEIELDPDHRIPELDESNNVAFVDLEIPPEPYVILNDAFYGRAGPFKTANGVIGGENHGATPEPGEPALGTGHTVWFDWIPPFSGPAAVEIRAVSTNTPLLIQAYTGESVANLTAVGSPETVPQSHSNRIRFMADAHTAYHLMVDSAAEQTAKFVIEWWLGPPADDSFGTNEVFSLNNINATKESGEPLHAGNGGGRSIWSLFFAKSSRPVTVSTEGSDFDTLLAVYTGYDLPQLTEIASNDDFGANRWSRVDFQASEGTLYWIAVDGKNGDSGHITLSADYAGPVLRDLSVTNSQLYLHLVGDTGAGYILETSTNLQTWTGIRTNRITAENGELPIALPFSTNTPSSFFRARQVPDRD